MASYRASARVGARASVAIGAGLTYTLPAALSKNTDWFESRTSAVGSLQLQPDIAIVLER